jgi:hypothetical protein
MCVQTNGRQKVTKPGESRHSPRWFRSCMCCDCGGDIVAVMIVAVMIVAVMIVAVIQGE